jgi:hypothetical protein
MTVPITGWGNIWMLVPRWGRKPSGNNPLRKTKSPKQVLTDCRWRVRDVDSGDSD